VPGDRELLDKHARALFTHDERSRLLTVNEPVYSTSWENAASQAVARKLGLTMYAADFHIT